MKKLIIAFSLIISFTANAQYDDIYGEPKKLDIEQFNFHLDGNRLLWRKVYPFIGDIEGQIAIIPGIRDLTKVGNSYTFVISGKFNYKNYGGRWGTMPIFMNENYEANGAIEVRDTAYRVTILDIFFYESNKNEMNYFKNFIYTKNNRVREVITDISFKYINLEFSDKFTLRQEESW